MIARQRKRRSQQKVTYKSRKQQGKQNRWLTRKDGVNLKRRESYQSDPSPTRRRFKEIYDKNPSPVRERARCSYRDNPSPVCKRVQDSYKKNPAFAQEKARKSYRENPTSTRERVRKSYRENPSPVRERVRKSYRENPSPVRERVRKSYRGNPSPVREKARKSYRVHPSPVRKRVKTSYVENPSPVRKRLLQKYHSNPSVFISQSRRAYHADVEASRSIKRQRYADNPLSAIKRSRIYYAKHHNLILQQAVHRRHTTIAAFNIKNKYHRIFNRKAKMSGTFSEYVQRLTKKMGFQNKPAKELKAQQLVRSCLQQLSLYKHNFISSFQRLQNMVRSSISKAAEVSSTNLEILDILCGESLHTSNTELYNCGACYHSEAFNKDGLLDFEKFPNCEINYIGDKAIVTWECSLDPPLCKLDGEVILTRLRAIYSNIIECSATTSRRYIRQMNDCSNDESRDVSLQGHPLQCYLYSPPCASELLYLRILAPHFPAIRRIVRTIYEVRSNDAKITEIEKALRLGLLDKILEIVTDAQTTRLRQYDVLAEVLNEQHIYKAYEKAFLKFNEKCLDVAKYPCMSCDKLCFERECAEMNRLKVIPNNIMWQNFLDFIESRPEFDDNLPNGYICDIVLNILDRTDCHLDVF